MSNFACPTCGAACLDGGIARGFFTGCQHFPCEISIRTVWQRTILAGSRTITDYAELLQAVESCPWKIKEVVSGCAQGVDRMGERWGKENGVLITRFPAEWGLYGNSAGPRRNAKMAEYAAEKPPGGLVLVWDGKSRGSRSMLDIALKRGLLVHQKIVGDNNPKEPAEPSLF